MAFESFFYFFLKLHIDLEFYDFVKMNSPRKKHNIFPLVCGVSVVGVAEMRRKKKIQTWSPSPALSNERCRGKPGGALTTDQLPESGGLKDAQTRFFDRKVGRSYAAVWKINAWNSKTCVRLRWSFWLDNRVNHIFVHHHLGNMFDFFSNHQTNKSKKMEVWLEDFLRLLN